MNVHQMIAHPPNAVEKTVPIGRELAYPFDLNQSLEMRDKPTLIHIKKSVVVNKPAVRKQAYDDSIAELELIGRKLGNFDMEKEGDIEPVKATPEVFPFT